MSGYFVDANYSKSIVPCFPDCATPGNMQTVIIEY